MFDNIGRKIKTLAKAVCWIGIIASVIGGIALMNIDDDFVLIGVLVAVLGSLLSWISSFVLYGFGQLVENSDAIAEQSERANYSHHKKEIQREKQQNKRKIEEIKQAVNDVTYTDDTYFDIKCPHCHENLSFTKQQFVDNEKLFCPMCDSEIITSTYKI